LSTRLSILIEANASSAKAELAATAKAADATTAALRDLKSKSEGAAKGAGLFDRALTPVSRELGTLNTNMMTAATGMAGMTADMRGATTGFTGMGTATRDMVQEARTAAVALQAESTAFAKLRASIDPTRRASMQYEAVLGNVQRAVSSGAATQAQANRVLDMAEAQYLATGRSAMVLGQSTGGASAQMGNLVAQFNDIGVMMMAGQNPLQMAIQQGTQISQVIGPMGAAGAIKALGGAFIGMLNPISLVTIGSIAAGAAIVNWLTSAGEEAETLEDSLSDLESAVSNYVASVRIARTPTKELGDEFGTAAQNAKNFFANAAEFGRQAALVEMQAAAKGLADQLRILDDVDLQLLEFDPTGLETLEFVSARINATFGVTIDQAKKIDQAMAGLAQATGPEAVTASATELYNVLMQVFGSFDKLPDAFKGSLGSLETLFEQSGAMLAAQTTEIERQAAIYGEYARTREVQAAAERTLAADRAAALAAEYGLLAQTRVESDADLGTAQSMLAVLNEQNEIMAATLQFGADSAEVADLRASAERKVFAEQVATLEVADSVKQALMAAFEAAEALSRVDVASGISAGASSAQRLAEWLGIALSAALQLEKITPAMADEDLAMSQGVIPDAGQRATNRNAVLNFGRLTTPKPAAGGARGGAGGAKAEADAVGELIEKLREEIEMQRQTDPVQKEMLKNREAMAGATDAERETIEALIEAKHRELALQETQDEMREAFVGTAYDAIRGLAIEGEKLSDVMDNVANAILNAVLQATLLGKGPLGGLLGGAGGGGILGSIAEALFPKAPGPIPALAGGGMIYGPGDGTSDDILMWGSSGEMMMNAKAVRANRHLLEAMNAGNPIPALARGGYLGGGAAGGGGSGDPILKVEYHGNTPMTETVEETTDSNGRRRFRLVLADATGDGLTTRGGGGRRAMRNVYGAKPRRTLR